MSTSPSTSPSTPPPLRLARSAFLLGVALGGFFDGILLHQVLQWHHLLSNVRASALADLRVQMLADGLFHALMYVLALLGLVLLWRRRQALQAPGAGREVLAAALAGFGAWHVLDTLVSHWITGIHRVRVDSPQPLLWDLLWLVAFGLLPLACSWLLQRRGSGGGGPGRRAAASLAAAVLLAGPIAARPVDTGGELLVLFAPGVAPAAAFDALARLDGRVRWVDRSGGLWAVAFEQVPEPAAFYREGALLVSHSALALGCFGSTRAAPAARN